MKREIKCRGFHKFGGISGWIYGSLLKDGENYYIVIPHTSYNVDPESIGEYTGLKDMYHKEIYEGDILGRNTDRNFVFVVDFSNGGFSGMTEPGRIHRLSLSEAMTLEKSPYVEVIGNIYQNPKILKT